MRWSKGFYQVNAKYGISLARGIVKGRGRSSLSCYDMLATVAPGMLLTLAMLVFNTVLCLIWLAAPTYLVPRVLGVAVGFIASTVASFYLFLLLYGLLTVLCEWKNIHIPAWKKLLYTLTFPLFMFTYIPISLAALLKKVEWTPIYHSGKRAALKRPS